MGDTRAHLNSAALGCAQLLTTITRMDDVALHKIMEHDKAANLDETVWALLDHVAGREKSDGT